MAVTAVLAVNLAVVLTWWLTWWWPLVSTADPADAQVMPVARGVPMICEYPPGAFLAGVPDQAEKRTGRRCNPALR